VSPIPYFPRWLKIERWKTSTEVPSEEAVQGLAVYHPRYFRLPKIFMPFHGFSMFLGCLPLVWKLNRQKRFDCIDAHFAYPDGMAGVLLGKLLKIPVVVSARGTDINTYQALKLIRPMIRWTLRQAAGVIGVSGALKEAMTALGIAAEKIRVIPNGVDASRFYRVSPLEARRRVGMPNGVPVVISAGALVDAKEHQILIHAVAKLVGRHPGLEVWILGEGPLRGALEKLARELHLGDRIHLPGKRPNEELLYWFSAADVSCLTSSREGWPNVVTESLACGTPVVGTRVGGIPEILHSSKLGVLVEQTAEDVAEGINKALTKEWDHESISRETRARSWEEVAAEVEEVLRAGIGRGSTRVRVTKAGSG